MEAVSVSKLKALLSQYLRKVKAGQEVYITDRGVLLAKIAPLGKEAKMPQLEVLIRMGQVLPPAAKLPKSFFDTKAMVPDLERHILQGILAERKSGR